jgi:nicotinamide mononucleotide transporter
MIISSWLSNNYIEIFGAITGIIYVFLEIRQTIWLWPLGIITSAVYIIVFFTSKFYADMSLQAYYVVISVLGWYWWMQGAKRREKGVVQRAEGENSPFESASADRRSQSGQGDVKWAEGSGIGAQSSEPRAQNTMQGLTVTRINLKLAAVLFVLFIVLYAVMFFILSRFTDSPVPEWDSFLTSLSIIATWMLARKIYEHWFLWIVVNTVSVILYFTRGLYPTVALYAVYTFMSFIGLKAWKATIRDKNGIQFR